VVGRRTATHRRLRIAHLFTLALALCAGAVASPLRADIDPDRERPLPWRSSGKLLFFTDVATSPGPDGKTRVDVAVRIPGDQLRYLDRGDSLVGEIRLGVEFKTRFGKGLATDERPYTLTSPPKTASGWSPGHLLLRTYFVPPGPHQLIVRIEDLQTKKRGLAYVGRKVPEKGVSEGLVTIAAYPSEGLAVGRPLFLWSATPGEKGSEGFRRIPGGEPVLPNPDRTYGLYAAVARSYFEVRPDPQAPEQDVVVRLLAADGRILALVDSVRVTETAPWSGRVGFEVATLPAGVYDVEVRVVAGSDTAVARNRLNVAWRQESWERDPRAFLEEAHFLLDDPDLESRYAEFTAGEQEAYLDRYWKERDPTPLTAQNEERDKFYERVRYANEHYGIAGVTAGMLSDRGRIYIRFGEPDEIRQQVIPTSTATLQDVAREIAYVDDDPAYIQLKKNTIGADERPFEVWTYNRAWDSAQERLRAGSQRRLMRKFVFVDEEGYGNYTLRYSSE
jgi:GWxTD domain-containing protein